MNGKRGWNGNETINWRLRWDRHLVNCDHEQHPDPGSDGLADVCLHLVCDRLLRHAGGVDDHGTVNDLARARGAATVGQNRLWTQVGVYQFLVAVGADVPLNGDDCVNPVPLIRGHDWPRPARGQPLVHPGLYHRLLLADHLVKP